jgi:multidrug efflux pump subunit AcrA (membrane-fusion protein)
MAEAKLRLDRMTVRSPIDGRVFRLIAHPGAQMGDSMAQMLGHDGRTVVTLYRPEMLQVRVDVRFEDIPKVLPNQPVVIENPALASSLAGTVLFINSEADIQKNTLQVKVAITDPPPVFKPEMLVDVTFLAPQRESSDRAPQAEEVKLYVLSGWIHTDDQDAYVWVADPLNQRARKTRVQTGATGSGGLVAITAGLNSSSRIIVSGAQSLADGDRIEISSEAAVPSGRIPRDEDLRKVLQSSTGAK